jgi:23S rRNA (cytosine1962-C5)-methyltransferase
MSRDAGQVAAVRLRLRITAAAETAVRSGHPWVFSDSVQESNRVGVTGELAVIYDRRDKFLAVGLYDADSPIRVRILHAGKPQTLDAIRFEADVVRGQKTGFFLDQRENRREVESLAPGRKVLNAFSFSGGFSVYAARGGAVSVTDLDISAHALESARRNFALNRNFPVVTTCRHETVQADAFEWIENCHRKFDLVVLDPPSLAKREAEREGAVRAYERLNSLGIRLLAHGGILVAGSCSAHVSALDFFGAVRRAAAHSGRVFSELKTTRHPLDHPAGFKEAEYLKMIYLRFEG